MVKKKNLCLFCQSPLDKIIRHGHHTECFQKKFNLKDHKSDFIELMLSKNDETSGHKTESRNTLKGYVGYTDQCMWKNLY